MRIVYHDFAAICKVVLFIFYTMTMDQNPNLVVKNCWIEHIKIAAAGTIFRVVAGVPRLLGHDCWERQDAKNKIIQSFSWSPHLNYSTPPHMLHVVLVTFLPTLAALFGWWIYSLLIGNSYGTNGPFTSMIDLYCNIFQQFNSCVPKKPKGK